MRRGTRSARRVGGRRWNVTVMPGRPWVEASVGLRTAQGCWIADMPSCRIAPGYPASPPRNALARARPVGEPAVTRAIGQAFDRRVAAETEILGARGADRPAASLLAQLEQRAAMFVVDRLVVGRRLRLGVQRLEHLILEPWHRSRAASLRDLLSRRASCIAAFFARQIEAGEFADDGVAAHPDVAGNFAAGQPGCKTASQEFDAFGGPGGFVGGHVDGPKLRVIAPNFVGLVVVRTAAPRRLPLWRLAIVPDRKQPVLDGEPNAFLDQGPCDAGNAGAVGALSHQPFEIGDGRERQRNRNTVGFGFFCGHAKKLAFNGCTEKYLFRVYSDSGWTALSAPGASAYQPRMAPNPTAAPNLFDR